MTGRRGFSLDMRDTHRCLSSVSVGTRRGAEGEVITSSGGSIKDLIKTFQEHEMQVDINFVKMSGHLHS